MNQFDYLCFAMHVAADASAMCMPIYVIKRRVGPLVAGAEVSTQRFRGGVVADGGFVMAGDRPSWENQMGPCPSGEEHVRLRVAVISLILVS